MNFSLDENQQEIANLAEKILSEMASDDRQKLIDASDARFDPELWQQLADSGLLGIAIDEQYGGMGFDFESLCLLVEACGKHVAAVPIIPTLVSVANTLQQFASKEQKQRWLPSIANGSSLLTSALYSNEELTLKGTQLEGQLLCVPYAAYAEGILVPARDASGELTLCIVDTKANGVAIETQRSTAGEPWSAVTFNTTTVNPENIIASGASAEQALVLMTQQSSAASCIMAVGVTEKMMRMTAAYTSERHQFGRPVATFQAVGQRAADCFIDIECFRLCTQEAISLLNLSTETIDKKKEIEEAVTIAKIWCGDVCHRVSQASQHLHGGIGVDRDYPLFRYCLWCKQLEIALGSSAQTLEQLGDQIAASF